METLRNLVLNLTVIVVLAVFLEMLLPLGEMRRYVRMVMGLLIVIAVLQCAGNLFREGGLLDLPAPAWSGSSAGGSGLQDITAGGRQLAAENQFRALEQYRQGLSRQMAALAGMSGQLTVRDVQVEVSTNPDDGNFGRIKQVRLLFAAHPLPAEEGRKNPLVAPVKVKVDNGADTAGASVPPAVAPEQEQAARRAALNIARFYNLSPDQVKYAFE